VAEPKCNADEQIFSQSAAGLTFSSARLSEVRAPDQCWACIGAAAQDIAAILDPAQFTGAASSPGLRRGQLFEEFEGTAREINHVASPRAHGMIRADYSDVVRKALQGEVGKDLVKLPVYEIEKQLLLSGAAR
jgi:hypothetical protein